MTILTLPRRPEIGLSAATYLGLGLEAMRAGDVARAVETFASIDSESWDAILLRFPHLADLVGTWEAVR